MKKLLSLLLVATLVLTLSAALIPAQAQEYVKLTWAQGTGADAPNDVAEVNEALNVISREKLGVEVDIVYLTNDQLNTKTQAGELFDMYFTCDWYNHFATAVNVTGLFADITDYIQTVTPDLYATMPEKVWELAKVNGRLYSIPVKKDYCPEIFIVYDKGFFDSEGIELPATMDKLAELEPYLEKFVEKHPGVYPLQMGGYYSGIDGFFNYIDRTASIGFNYNKGGTEEGRKIISVFEDDQMIERMTTLHEWYKKGWTNPDAATMTESSLDKKINYFKIAQCWDGYDGYTAAYGYETGLVRISGPYLSTSGVQGSMNALCVTLEDDPAKLELALKYQELVNTDKKYRDMLRYGIEGVHFNYRDDGAVVRTEKGKNDYGPWAFSQGSYSLSSLPAPDETTPVNLTQWEDYFKVCDTAQVAEDVGFVFDSQSVQSQIAAIGNVKETYLKVMFSGTVDPAEYVPKVIAEMEAAGLREVIAEAQRQFDEFKAAQ
ncbi:MAG: ABC transporter substrate-binding protein [Christensenellales bacterium]|jgi:putative aldouronate transport system substrate-binding protein